MGDFIKPQRYKQVLELFFPPSEDELILRHSTPATFTDQVPTLQHGVFSLLPYQTKAVAAAIHLAKFHHHHQAIQLLATPVSSFLAEHVHTHTIIPIPLSRRRERERGYNQVTEILRAAKRTLPPLRLDTRTLKRQRHTAPQTSLARAERLHNLTDAFAVTRAPHIHHQDVIIVDDVTTTGATLEAARTAVAAHQPHSITCVAIAH